MNNINKQYKIYAHINKINGKVYIGQTCYKNINQRWRHGEGYKRSPHFYNAIQKYGWENFEHIILFEDICGYELADAIERELIQKYQSNNSEYGYNISSGGSYGRTLTDETKNKIRISKIGDKNPNYQKSPSYITRQRMSASHKGIKQSDEWINKRKRVGEQNGMYGRTLPKESKELISKKTKGGNNPSAKRCFLFSNIDDLKEYECLSYAYKTINMGTKYCRNHRLSGIYEKETGRIVFILTEVEFSEFIKWTEENNKEINWFNIQNRYDLYNEYFYSIRKDGTIGQTFN